MSEPAERAAEKLLSAVTTAQSALADLHPLTYKEEREILQQTILRLRGIYARLLASREKG